MNKPRAISEAQRLERKRKGRRDSARRRKYLKPPSVPLTLERLKSVLLYNPELGTWVWLAQTQRAQTKIGDAAGGVDPKNGILHIRVDTEIHSARQLAWFYMTGEWPTKRIRSSNPDKSACKWLELSLETRKPPYRKTNIKRGPPPASEEERIERKRAQFRNWYAKHGPPPQTPKRRIQSAQASARWRSRHREEFIDGKRRFYREHREKILEQKRLDYHKKPDQYRAVMRASRSKHRDKLRKKARDDYSANREKILSQRKQNIKKNPLRYAAIAARHRVKNKEGLRKQVVDWRRRNPMAAVVYRNRRRARIIGSGGSHDAQDVAEILKAQRSKCAYCKIRLSRKKHLDHIIPLARGGSNARNNLQFLCPDCNHKKHAKDPIYFARQMGMLL